MGGDIACMGRVQVYTGMWWGDQRERDHLQDTGVDGSKGKGKSVPLQTWSGPEGSRKLRFPDFMTTAQGGGKFVSHKNRPHLPPGNSPGSHFC